jgi:hypothetical protein
MAKGESLSQICSDLGSNRVFAGRGVITADSGLKALIVIEPQRSISPESGTRQLQGPTCEVKIRA